MIEKLTTKDVLNRLDFSKQEKFYINEDFLNLFEMNYFDYQIDDSKSKLTFIPIVVWYCTDSWVGINVILLNSKPIAMSTQLGRKCHVEFEFTSKEAFGLVKSHLQEISIHEEIDNIPLLNLEQEFGNTYKVSFANEYINQFHNEAYYQNKKVLVNKISSTDYIEQNVQITFESGESMIVEIEELDFPILNVKELKA